MADRDESVDLDPEVLKDPLGEDAEGQASAPAEDKTVALVPHGGSSLAPYDPFRRYMDEIRKYPPLSREEEQELARRYRDTGDRDALLRLISANLMLVVRVALSFRRAARNLLDLIQEGNVGLLRAIDRFDPEMGNRLPTYAAWWVRAYMVKFLLDNVRLVRVGTTNARRKLLRNLRKEKQRLELEGFETGPKQLAEHFGVSENDVVEVEQALESRDVSLDAPVAGDDERPRAERMPDSREPAADEQIGRRELQRRTEEALERFRVDLDERDRLLLDDRLLSEEPLTLREIGERFGTTREAVRQAEARLKKRLGEFLQEELGDLGQIGFG
ncbi:MAG: sigma-70 family RNA polymerase sigma factor [bacterium]|nr:sigma-70 family RNA polymerase sigma factor [bacterium]